MRKFNSLILTAALALSLSFPAQAAMPDLPMITSGYTEEGVYYEVHGEIPAQRSNSVEVTRIVAYSGDITPSSTLAWTENIQGHPFSGTLSLVSFRYDIRSHTTLATYQGTLTAD